MSDASAIPQPLPRPARGRNAVAAAALPGLIVLGFFFALPLAAILIDSATPGAFARALALPAFWRSLVGSLWLTAVAAGVSTLVGFLVALHLSRLPERRRALLLNLIALPLTFSGLIVAYGFILAYGRAGFVTQLLGQIGLDPAATAGFLYSTLGLAFASSYYLIPRVTMLMLPVLANFDRAQIAAAQSLGASNARAVADVLLPQVLPSLVGAFCLVAAVVFGAYGTALALVGTRVNILPLQLYSMISETGSDLPAAAALAVVLTGCCSLFLVAGEAFAAWREERRG